MRKELTFSCVGCHKDAASREGCAKLVSYLNSGQEMPIFKLVPEPENAYDPNAILVTWEENRIGYVSSEHLMMMIWEYFSFKKSHDWVIEYIKFYEPGVIQWMSLKVVPVG